MIEIQLKKLWISWTQIIKQPNKAIGNTRKVRIKKKLVLRMSQKIKKSDKQKKKSDWLAWKYLKLLPLSKHHRKKHISCQRHTWKWISK